MSWYRTYRPQRIADLHIKPVRESLLRVLSSGEFAHAYLLAGPKGTGKTSAARILAKVLNCERNRDVVTKRIQNADLKSENKSESRKLKSESLQEPCNECYSCIAITDGSSMSVMEMDAASNRGIDDIRLLRERIGLAPSDGLISVFIIDEVHMLTTEAFNALLKVLEEPPAHVVFILATTDAQKMPATVVSRCTLIQYRKATAEELKERLKQIAKAEAITISDASLALIATAADGSFRDGVKVFEQLCIGKKEISDADVDALIGAVSSRLSADLLTSLLKKETQTVVKTFSLLAERAIDGVAFEKEVLSLAHAKLVEFAATNDPRLGTLVMLLKSIAVPLEPNLPVAWLPFEIACVEYTIQATDQGPQTREQREPTAEKRVPTKKETSEVRSQLSEQTREMIPTSTTTTVIEEKSDVSGTPAQEPLKEKSEPMVQSPKSDVIVSFETIQEQWPMVLAKVRAKSIPMEGLVRATRVVGIDGSAILIEASYQFHKEQMELDRNARILEEIFEQIFGAKLRYRVTLAKAAIKVISSPHRNVSGTVVDEKLVKAAEEAFL